MVAGSSLYLGVHAVLELEGKVELQDVVGVVHGTEHLLDLLPRYTNI